LGRYGFQRDDASAIVAKARVASSMKANPIVLTDDELTEILLAAA
jgi:alcohol dehydrogenase class IV